MAPTPSDEVSYLKSLVSQLNTKIKQLEEGAKNALTPTPQEQLRMIIMGPPGAGKSYICVSAFVLD